MIDQPQLLISPIRKLATFFKRMPFLPNYDSIRYKQPASSEFSKPIEKQFWGKTNEPIVYFPRFSSHPCCKEGLGSPALSVPAWWNDWHNPAANGRACLGWTPIPCQWRALSRGFGCAAGRSCCEARTSGCRKVVTVECELVLGPSDDQWRCHRLLAGGFEKGALGLDCGSRICSVDPRVTGMDLRLLQL